MQLFAKGYKTAAKIVEEPALALQNVVLELLR